MPFCYSWKKPPMSQFRKAEGFRLLGCCSASLVTNLLPTLVLNLLDDIDEVVLSFSCFDPIVFYGPVWIRFRHAISVLSSYAPSILKCCSELIGASICCMYRIECTVDVAVLTAPVEAFFFLRIHRLRIQLTINVTVQAL